MAEKVKVDEFQRVCRLAKLVERKATIPTFTTQDNKEGLELKTGKIIPFWIKDGEKMYNQPVSDTKIASVIGAFEEKPKEVKKDEKAPDKVDEGKGLDIKAPEKQSVALLPEFLTPALMTKWAQMSTTDRILMFQQTPKDQVFEVAVGKNPDTGKQEFASYVKGNYMIREANAAFLYRWYLEVEEVSVSESGVCVRGLLWGWFKEYDTNISRPATGYQERNKKVDAQQAIKGATTDAIKKGLSLFGFNSDVYSGEV